MYWWLAAGPTYTSGSLRSTWTAYSNADFAAGQGVNILDSTSNEFYLTGVQFEIGTQVTPFEYRSFGEELSLCQRYFQAYPHDDNSTANGLRLNGDYSSVFQTAMRDTPTGTVYGVGGSAGGNSGKYDKDAVGCLLYTSPSPRD